MTSIEKLYIKPFLSILFGENSGTQKPDEIHNIVLDIIENENRKKVQLEVFKTSNDTSGEVVIHYTPYQVTKTPGWYNGPDVNNIENHIVISFCLNKTYAFYFSEKGIKDEVRSYFHSTRLPYLDIIKMESLNYLFVNEDSIKMLWLLSIDGKNSFKADSKVLGGNSVADTLDPLEDQSFAMSAVRTELDDSGSTIGINPFKSSLWRGPCKDWYTFENRVIELLDKINKNTSLTKNPISILATPLNTLGDVNILYDLVIAECDYYLHTNNKIKYELLKEINENYSFVINDMISSHEISIRVSLLGQPIGEISAKAEIKDYLIHFNVKSIPEHGCKSALDSFSKIFKYPDLIKCWYESGHSFINGRVFQTDYQDVEYDNFIWADFETALIRQEKPEVIEKKEKIIVNKKEILKDVRKVALNRIGLDNSLFCWVKNRWSGCWNEKSNFITTEKPSGWLYCDDGAGEKADFIHIVEFKNKIYISFIHVKAAKSDSKKRQISVGAHDVVLNQAIKNLRYSNRKNLVSALNDRIKESVKKFCWKDNAEKKPSEFIDFLESIKTQSNVKTRIIVIQPHTRKKCYENSTGSSIKKLLAVLLVSAETAVKSCGAEFYIIGFDDSNIRK